jgi:ferredoxin-NADP reductase
MANDWKVATLLGSEMIARNIKSLKFKIDGVGPHKAGQHYDIRLTAEDGYQAERSYSIASPPEETDTVEFGVELLESGEVSPYLFGMQPGDQMEVLGPIGGHFTWDVSMKGPLVLIGGGSGMVPLMAMLRHRERHLDQEKGRPVIFLASVKSFDDMLYYDELRKISAQDPDFRLVITFTRMAPPNWDGYRRRVDENILKELLTGVDGAMIYVCGPTAFVESVASGLLNLGVSYQNVRTERFGGLGVIE